jgi:uncharacterized protein
MCVLMLSGPQTVGEIRTRGSRLHEFSSLEEVDETLRGLSARDSEPLVMKLPRQSGQKDARYVHLLSGEPDLSHLDATITEQSTRRAGSERTPQLEEQVQALRQQVEELARQFADFRKQFE